MTIAIRRLTRLRKIGNRIIRILSIYCTVEIQDVVLEVSYKLERLSRLWTMLNDRVFMDGVGCNEGTIMRV